MKWWWPRWALEAAQSGGSAVILRETPPTAFLMVARGHLASPRGTLHLPWTRHYSPPAPRSPSPTEYYG
ncbi:hypothetical protein E2C01_094076 [Portunus trituberculatus]|uniref:Uncharacterized protein n=1 Tax=Portunus trituberculatus TaxID=210409 RepID=A0A5B7JWN4_PORTR|nr:hypothetical protein [Portunus trituberculatus]